ncbi:hypothetical protein D3C78_1600500 [compost metagenome]
MKAWPNRGWLPSSSKKVSASAPKWAPVSVVTSNSTINASIAPLTPPMGSIEPSMPFLGSVVGWPSASSAQPSGMLSPFLAATMSLPRATSDSDRSMLIGWAPLRGKIAAMGLVPKMGRLPPAAGMAAGELLQAMPTMPAAATASRW